MALNSQFSNAAVNASVNGLTALLNNGYLRIYDGSQPANANTAITSQVKLAELRWNATAFGAAVAGVANANSITSDNSTVAGTAAWFRALESDGTTVVFDGTVGTSGCNINLTTTTITTSGTLTITAFVLTQAEA